MLGLAIGAGALLAAGCGGSDDDAGTDEEVEAAATGTGSTAADPGSTEGTPVTDGSGGADEPAGGAAPGEVDACAALAGVDLEALLAEPVAAPEGSTDIMGANCFVEPVADTSAGLRLVVSNQEPADNFANQRELLGVDSEVTGLGDEAFHTGPYLFVLRGDTLVFVQVVQDAATGAGVDDAQLEAAMTTILGNLPA
jgi:hypothetical protein